MVMLWLACAGPGQDTAAPVDELLAVRILARASLDLRGRRPTLEEFEAVEHDPAALDAHLDAFVQDDALPERVAALYAERLRTETEFFPILANDVGPDTPQDLWASVGAEPLRVIEHIARHDLPWTEAVTGDWTVADENLARYWPLDHEGDGWQVSRYTDGRPAAGILATNGFHWRYTSTLSNANRGRANAASRIFLCNDYLSRELEFEADLDLLDDEAVRQALAENPHCVNCHVSLDPLAAHFWGFFLHTTQSPLDGAVYHRSREPMWADTTGVPPSYYGTPSETLADLGQRMASDGRFVSCAVESLADGLLRRPTAGDDLSLETAHREVFLANDLALRPLMRSLVDDPRYRGQAVDGAVDRKLVTTDVLARQVADLTGHTWTVDDLDVLDTDVQGLRILAGGMDGYMVTEPSTTATPTLVLVQRRLAERAAAQAGEDLLDRGVEDAAGVRQQIEALHIRVLSERPSADELDALVADWESFRETEGSVDGAWTALLTLLMRDPAFLVY